MSIFRRLLNHWKQPDRLLKISERIYVFHCCLSTAVLEEDEYKVYLGDIMAQLQDYFPDASFLVLNFSEGDKRSQFSDVLSQYYMTVIDYPRQYENCPLLSLESIHHFLRSCEGWLSLAQGNILLLHCERGGWPLLAFMLACLLLYLKIYTGEQKTLNLVYKQGPNELLRLFNSINPQPSQLRYLQYISRRNHGADWPPSLVRVYGQDPLTAANTSSKLLYSNLLTKENIRNYVQAEHMLVKVDICCYVRGDVVVECFHLYEDLVHKEMIFRVMFHTAYIRSNILMLNRDDIDILWDGKEHIPEDFRTEVLFSDADGNGTTTASLEKSYEAVRDALESNEISNYTVRATSETELTQPTMPKFPEASEQVEATTQANSGHYFQGSSENLLFIDQHGATNPPVTAIPAPPPLPGPNSFNVYQRGTTNPLDTVIPARPPLPGPSFFNSYHLRCNILPPQSNHPSSPLGQTEPPETEPTMSKCPEAPAPVEGSQETRQVTNGHYSGEPAPGWKHDVFISFRGEDTRRGFVSHLYHELQSTKLIRIFMDDIQLKKGKIISQSLLAAIEESRFAIIVLSEHYAFSTWCLDELSKIFQCMENKDTILPIFYHVDPSDVRYQKSSFGVDFEKHENHGRHAIEKVKQWRADITKVGNLSGWDSKNYKSERELIEDIVKVVLKEVLQVPKRDFTEFEATKVAMAEINKMLMDEKGTAIGVYGRGGVGKTTMVKHVGAQAKRNGLFDHVIIAVVSHNPDVRKIQWALASQLGLELLVDEVKGRASSLKETIMGGKRILIILDDIWENIDMQSIGIPSYEELQSCNSKVLLTTRVSDLCLSMGWEEAIPFNILSEEKYLKLFMKMSRKPFRESSDSYDKERSAVRECSGPPSVLEQAAKPFEHKYVEEWNEGVSKAFGYKSDSNNEIIYLPHLNILKVYITDAACLCKDIGSVEINCAKFEICISRYFSLSSNDHHSKTLTLDRTINGLPDWFIKKVTEKAEKLEYRDFKGVNNILEEYEHGRLYGLKHLSLNGSHENLEGLISGTTWDPSKPVFESLEELHLLRLQFLSELCVGELPRGSLCKLKLLKVQTCRNLASALLPLKLLQSLKNLETIYSVNMKHMKYVFGSEGLDPGMVLLKKFSEMRLCALYELVSIWNGPAPLSVFGNLKVLAVCECPKLKILFPFDIAQSLVQLEDLSIERCCNLVIVVEASNTFDRYIFFPQLKKLSLIHLSELKWLCTENGSIGIECPLLEYLYVDNCPQFMNTASASASVKLNVQQHLNSVAKRWEDMHEL